MWKFFCLLLEWLLIGGPTLILYNWVGDYGAIAYLSFAVACGRHHSITREDVKDIIKEN